jgi:hypothetical protein
VLVQRRFHYKRLKITTEKFAERWNMQIRILFWSFFLYLKLILIFQREGLVLRYVNLAYVLESSFIH